MLGVSIVLATLLAIVTPSLSLPKTPSTSGIQRTDTYDDLGTSTATTSLTSDGGIIYSHGFQWDTRSSNTLPGVNSQSPPNRALYNTVTDTSSLNPPSLATDEVCVLLQTFYAGCSLSDGQGAATAPVACTITLTGYGVKNNVVGTQSFVFTPTGPTTSNMGYFVNHNIRQAKVIDFNTTVTGTDAVSGDLVSSLFDTVSYTQFTNSADCGSDW